MTRPLVTKKVALPSAVSPLQRTEAAPEHDEVPAVVHEVLRTAGQPLEEDTRRFFETRFGHDFSRVRVHTDAKAAESARAVSAQAYMVKDRIVFGSRQFTPGTTEGKRLLAHELTHVVQQADSCIGGKAPVVQRSEKQPVESPSADEEVRSLKDAAGPPDTAWGRMEPASDLSAAHQQKVKKVIDWALNKSIRRFTDLRTGEVTVSRYEVIESAHRLVISELRENPDIPKSSTNLIFRDADHYLVSRLGMSGFVKQVGLDPEKNPELSASLAPFGLAVYEALKLAGHAGEAVTGEAWTPLRSNKSFPPAQTGGNEWALLGVRHYLKYDKGKMHKNEAPELFEETAAERLVKAVEQSYGMQKRSFGTPGDHFEMEAEVVAEAIVGEPAPQRALHPVLLSQPLADGGCAGHDAEVIRCKVSPELKTIREKLSTGFLKWSVKGEEVREVLRILGRLDQTDLKDTVAALVSEGLAERIFRYADASDRKREAPLLDTIRQMLPGKSLLMHISEALVCDKPHKGSWELAASFGSLDNLLETVEKTAWQFPLFKLGVLAHGDMGGVIRIGTDVVNLATLGGYSSKIRGLNRLLTATADVFIFGCVSGVGRDGSALLKRLSLLVPGKRVIGFNVITAIPEAEAKMPGEMCYWPDIRATDIKASILQGKIRSKVPADENAASAKIARDGKIIKWPYDESSERDDEAKGAEKESGKGTQKSSPSIRGRK